jgi:ligand-binding SRPBCC domain-containing protein
MHAFTLTVDLTLPCPIDRVFPFFADAGNLEAITPPFLRFKILTPRPIPMHQGALIDYHLRLHGVPIRWRTVIDAWDPPHRFIDRQLKGPYTLWHHTHTFEPLPPATPGGPERTLVRDVVRYRPILAPLSQSWFVRPRVDAIFRFRQAAIARLILGDDAANRLPPPPAPVHGVQPNWPGP